MKIEENILQLEVYVGGLYREELGIFLIDRGDYFKWFLASVLFGARIPENCAKRAYLGLREEGITNHEAILKTDYDEIVGILDQNAYARYDFKTADKMKEMATNIMEDYDGDILNLITGSDSYEELSNRLKALAKGIGDITVNIYLREFRGVVPNADPPISELALIAAKNLKIAGRLRTLRVKNPVLLARIEAICVRLAKYYCKKEKCSICPARDICHYYPSIK
ncbi:MAG: hypothetical protein GWP03_06185 [Proteobacteria bacterium]|nr:hypothetical protein [Pseudomonadota bacterium]